MNLEKLVDLLLRQLESPKELLNLILYSYALDEQSMSQIMSTQTKLLSLMLCTCLSENQFQPHDLLKMNRSVADILRLILEKEKALQEKLRRLYQFHEDQYF